MGTFSGIPLLNSRSPSYGSNCKTYIEISALLIICRFNLALIMKAE